MGFASFQTFLMAVALVSCAVVGAEEQLHELDKSKAFLNAHCVSSVSYTHLRAHETDS